MSNRLDTLAGHVLVLIAVVAVTLAGYYRADAKVSEVATEAHASLCAFKLDLERRNAEGEKFVKAIREGQRPPIPGLTLAELERSLDHQKRTLDSLEDLDCS